MNLTEYFATRGGTGIMSTADKQGKVDAAIYASPHIMEGGSLAMIMRERLTYKNLQENPYAVYLFLEDSPIYAGVRLFLKKTGEDDNAELISKMTRRSLSGEEDQAKGAKHIVYFQLEKTLNLIGGEEV